MLPLLAVFAMMFGFAAPTQGSTTSRRVSAMLAVADGRAVRWISPYEMCVVPHDASDLPTCSTRPRVRASAVDNAAARHLLKPYANTWPFVACMKASREIPVGDSVLVVVGLTGGDVADGLASSSAKRVWFRAVGDKDTMKDTMYVASAAASDVVSAVAPVLSESGCR